MPIGGGLAGVENAQHFVVGEQVPDDGRADRFARTLNGVAVGTRVFQAVEAVCNRRASSLPIGPRYLPLRGLASNGNARKPLDRPMAQKPTTPHRE